MFNHLSLTIAPNGVATLTLNRPTLHNAFNEVMIAELITALKQLEADEKIRIVQLAANGENFSAGADIEWMQRMAKAALNDNLNDAKQLATLMQTLYHFTKPTIALVQGAAIGGGVGLVACCDIVIAQAEARFSFPEVRLGLIPAVISPYVIAAIGARAAQRYFLTVETFSAAAAQHLGLVHIIATKQTLAEASDPITTAILKNGPAALQAAKTLIKQVAYRPIDNNLSEETALSIAKIRVSPEGQEGTSAFLEKRKPKWIS
jgi:methylglutaconyl-CoA hydratase